MSQILLLFKLLHQYCMVDQVQIQREKPANGQPQGKLGGEKIVQHVSVFFGEPSDFKFLVSYLALLTLHCPSSATDVPHPLRHNVGVEYGVVHVQPGQLEAGDLWHFNLKLLQFVIFNKFVEKK